MTEREIVLRRGREGGRWINERPTPEGFAEWFSTSMKIDPALNIEDYIGGVVLIPAVDTKAKVVVGFTDQGRPIIDTREELSYVPYAKVEARTAYFWDLLEVHPEWLGVVENVSLPRLPVDQVTTQETETINAAEVVSVIERSKIQPGGLATMVHQLPDGFSITSVPVAKGYTHFLCATIRVAIYDREEYKAGNAVPLRAGRGTKQVPLLIGRQDPYADPNALMKCETGALGRALGFAGIFVIPGSGVATAEDMLEALSQGAPPVDTNVGPSAPDEPPARTGVEQAVADEDALSRRANELWGALQASAPAKAEEFIAWAKARKLTNLSEARGSTLRGVVKKLERLSDGAGEEERVPEPSTAPG